MLDFIGRVVATVIGVLIAFRIADAWGRRKGR